MSSTLFRSASWSLKIDDYDVVLLGPQIRFKLDEVKKTAEEHGKAAEVIDMRVYGMMNGEVQR